MRLGRKQDLSVIYWLRDKFSGTGVEVVDGFNQLALDTPSIGVEWDKIDTFEYELGSNNRIHVRDWYLNIYATSKTQKDEIVFKLLDDLEDEEINVNNYDEGFPPSVTPTRIGVLVVKTLRAKNIQVLPELVEKLHYRAVVNFITQYETIGGI